MEVRWGHLCERNVKQRVMDGVVVRPGLFDINFSTQPKPLPVLFDGIK